MCYPPNPCIDVDPPFTIGFLVDPTTGQSAEIGTPVPEPASLMLLLSGMMVLVARRGPFDAWQQRLQLRQTRRA
jgi:hypothetical protein